MGTPRTNRIRVIGGQYRGRWLAFPDIPGLRPTGDRVRETLFNWLQPKIAGARCLDLFAGSGALGFEAVSRGAVEAVLVERGPEAIATMRENARRLGIDNVRIVQADAGQWLALDAGCAFDVVFLDPPFSEGLVEGCCARLEHGGWLNAGALVYLELPAEAAALQLPENWALIRWKRAGRVHYGLAERRTR